MTTITAPDTSAFEALDASLTGDVVVPESPEYDAARRVWNGEVDRRPAAIARCRGVADVMAAVRHARDHDLPASVRGGGHAVAGHAVLDDGLVIDLSGMTGARVDPVARTVQLEGGALNAHLDRETQAFGLAATGGFVSHTGAVGLTLGGGIGHLMRRLGLAVDAVRGADVVTADGTFVRASAEENPDLFWALRGGGGNFGVVTSLTMDLQPLGPQVLAGLVAWPAAQADAVLAFMRDFVADAPDELGLMANLRLAPPLPLFPPEVQGTPIIALVVTWSGDIEAGERFLRPLRAFGTPVADAITTKAYTAHQKMLDAAVPHGRHYYWKSHRLGPLTGEVIDVICTHLGSITSPMSSVPIFCFGGAMARVPEDATAFPHRDAAHDINIVASWLPEQAGESDRHRAWVRGFFDALAPHSRGVYVNFTSDDAQSRVREAYSPTQWDRLRAAKTVWDPTNFFDRNANIPPA
ncbi:FAD-linked oxidase [Nocardioides sp. Soil777]|uniref:FAD-binding oxidoreductase n=1 Tax=Nocardioides sp. Soil777 TaxID=1736409 RepID=UPI000702D9CD|nr:FAD-binding oxidoreductase [Nocardioides sp. Soil777]KRE98773.1 FAD-linked oxidase [Nocardioides sp. Soil777]